MFELEQELWEDDARLLWTLTCLAWFLRRKNTWQTGVLEHILNASAKDPKDASITLRSIFSEYREHFNIPMCASPVVKYLVTNPDRIHERNIYKNKQFFEIKTGPLRSIQAEILLQNGFSSHYKANVHSRK